MMKIARLVALAAAGLLVCMPAAAQRLANFPAAGTVSATDTVLGQQPSLCATNATVCNGVQISTAQLSAYILPGGVAPLATKLSTARTINGVPFDGSAAITINAVDSTPRAALAGATFTGAIGGTTASFSGAIAAANFSGSSAGSNTGDQTITLTGDVIGSGTGSFPTTLATVNAAPGACGSSGGLTVPLPTINGKGLITSCSTYALGSAAGYAIGTSGGAIGLLNGNNTYSGSMTFTQTINGSVSGSANTAGAANTANKWAMARTFSFAGDANGSLTTDGSANAGATLTLATSGVTAGTYGGAGGSASVTFDAKGRATGASTSTLGVAGGGTGRTTAMPILSVSRNTGNSSTFVTVANSFTTIVLTAVSIDSASAYSTSSGIYTLPETGVYLITSKVRLADNVTAGVSYGLGVDTANQDGAEFGWWTTTAAANSSAARQGAVNFRVYSGTAGDQLRLFAYVDSSNGLGVNSAEMNIYRIR